MKYWNIKKKTKELEVINLKNTITNLKKSSSEIHSCKMEVTD